MKYLRGYLTAAIFGAIAWVLMQFGQRYTELVDMVYPYVIRTVQTFLAQWTGGVDFCVWQLLAVALGVLILASVVLMVILKWNPIQWFGWVAAVFACIYSAITFYVETCLRRKNLPVETEAYVTGEPEEFGENH